MKKISAIMLVFVSLFVTLVSADTYIKAEVDKARITTDEILTYKLSTTSSAKKIPNPELPAFEGFVLLSKAQSSKISISAGVQTSSVTYVFILVPIKAGKFEIGPSRVQIEGKDYLSDAFEIEVTQGKVGPKAKSEEKSEAPQITL